MDRLYKYTILDKNYPESIVSEGAVSIVGVITCIKYIFLRFPNSDTGLIGAGGNRVDLPISTS